MHVKAKTGDLRNIAGGFKRKLDGLNADNVEALLSLIYSILNHAKWQFHSRFYPIHYLW